MLLLTRIALLLAVVSTIVSLTLASEPPAKPKVKVEFFWGEGKPVPGLTQDKGIVWGESGETMYLHKQPILTNKDVVKVEVSKTVFGVGTLAQEHFTIKFHLTPEARKRLAETCGASGSKMLSAMIDGQHWGAPYYLKSRDESNFVPFAGMFPSKELADRIVAAFAPAVQDSKDSAPQSKAPPAKLGTKVELRWAEFKPIAGVTENQGIPFGEEGTSLTFLHKQPVLTIEDIAEARVEKGVDWKINGKTIQMHSVTLHFTKEGQQKLVKSGEPGKSKLLALLIDGRNTSTSYLDVVNISKYIQHVGGYEKTLAEDIAAGINAAIAAARPNDPADKPKAGETKKPISAANANHVRRVAEIEKQVHKIVLGPGSGELAFFDYGNVEIVDDVNFRPLRKVAEQSSPIDFALSHDGRFAAWHVNSSHTYVLQELASGMTVEIKVEKSPGFAAFSRDSKLLAIGETFWFPNVEGEGTSAMKLFDLSGKPVRTLESPGPGVMTPVFSPDGKTLAVGNRNYETRLFDVATGKLLHTLPRRMTHEVAFSPDGKLLAAGYVDGAVVLWNVSNGTEQQSIRNIAKEIYTLDWSPKGDVLVTAGREGKIVLWDPNKMAALKELDSPGWVSSVRFMADGTRLLSSGGSDYGRTERKVVIWAIPDDIEK